MVERGLPGTRLIYSVIHWLLGLYPITYLKDLGTLTVLKEGQQFLPVFSSQLQLTEGVMGGKHPKITYLQNTEISLNL